MSPPEHNPEPLSERTFEALSRLIDVDLPPDEAEALRARVAAEPALAEATTRLRALKEAVASLPEVSPPPSLNAAILRRARDEARAPALTAPPWRRWPLGLAAAAAALLAFTVATPGDPTLTLYDGQQLIDGAAQVQVADVGLVTIEGKALISVEPGEGGARDRLAEDNPMKLAPILSAALGSALTIAVYEGKATFTPNDGPAVTVEAGERRRVTLDDDAQPALAGQGPRRRGSEGDAVVFPSPDGPGDLPNPKDELARLRLENDLLRGQLRAAEGAEQPWPKDAPDALREPGFGKAVRAAIEDDMTLLDLDCDEFPCIAFVEMADEPGRSEAVVNRIQAQLKPEIGGDMGVMAMERGFQTPEGGGRVLAIAVSPASMMNEESGKRTQFRAETGAESAIPEADF
jgi:ferric-dicitrate binding protein FerR (iron transport regulator)